MKLKVNHFQQATSNSCGLAALRMILDYYGERVTEKELKKEVSMHSFGTFSTDLGVIALKRGYKVTSYAFHLSILGFLELPFGTKITEKVLKRIKVKAKDKMTFNSWKNYLKAGGELVWDNPRISLIDNYLKKKAPCLISVNTAALGDYWKRWNNGHYLVVTGFEKEKISVLDPNQSKGRGGYFIKNDIFLPAWFVNSFNSSDYLTVIEKVG